MRLSCISLRTGLFRKPEAAAKSKKRRRKPVSAAGDDVVLGSLADLRAASKGGMDPSGVQADWVVTYRSQPISTTWLEGRDSAGCLSTVPRSHYPECAAQGKAPRWWLPT